MTRLWGRVRRWLRRCGARHVMLPAGPAPVPVPVPVPAEVFPVLEHRSPYAREVADERPVRETVSPVRPYVGAVAASFACDPFGAQA